MKFTKFRKKKKKAKELCVMYFFRIHQSIGEIDLYTT